MSMRTNFASSLSSSPYVECPGIIYPISLRIVFIAFKVGNVVTKRTIEHIESHLQTLLNMEMFSTE